MNLSTKKFTDRAYSLGVGVWKVITRGDPCVYCGGKSETKEHVIPLSQGGFPPGSGWTCVGACARCNKIRGDAPFLRVFGKMNHHKFVIRSFLT